MKPFAIVVLVLSVAGAACNRATPASNASGSLTAEPAAGASQGAQTSNGLPSAGTRETASEAGARAIDGASNLVSGAAAAVAAAVTPAPSFDEVTIPTGTVLSLVLDTPVNSESSRVEDQVRAHLSKSILVGGTAALPAGSALDGVVTAADRSGKVKGRAHVAFRFDRLTRAEDSERYTIATAPVSRTAAATKKKDAVKVGGGALGGALVGAIVGGKKGAAIGTAAGAGAGGAVVLSTRGDEVHLPTGTAVTVRLSEPLVVRVPRT